MPTSWKYPASYLKKDGGLKQTSANRKRAAAYRKTHTQAGKRRVGASSSGGTCDVHVKKHCRSKAKK